MFQTTSFSKLLDNVLTGADKGLQTVQDKWATAHYRLYESARQAGVSEQKLRQIDANSEWILGAVMGTILALLVGVALFSWLRPAPQAEINGIVAETSVTTSEVMPAHTILSNPQKTAHIGFAIAQKTALDWQPDAQLLNATATWGSSNNPDAFQAESATWLYSFYSPAAKRVALFAVNDETKILADNPVSKQYTLLPAGNWHTDSNKVVTTLMEMGGREFVAQHGTSNLTLSLSVTNNQILWMADLIAEQTGAFVSVTMDANSGETIDFEQIQ